MNTGRTRREFIQGLIISVGGAVTLTACGDGETTSEDATITATPTGNDGRFYIASEMALLSRLSDLIIPSTETPGALDANVPGYLDGLMADWASEVTRQAQHQTMQDLAARLNSAVDNFLEVDNQLALSALTELDSNAFNGDDSLSGYRTLKGYITQAFFATEEGALQELKWVAIPGRWDPSVDIVAAD
ncbi:MAG: gluconate 2-dehydrogenase subunit 3 family protein [Gammaproteobacteria bacterium]|nr:gluconate 2-dehydrogenase subunit 3 family protein [Gammaproteobacteria bacterium]